MLLCIAYSAISLSNVICVGLVFMVSFHRLMLYIIYFIFMFVLCIVPFHYVLCIVPFVVSIYYPIYLCNVYCAISMCIVDFVTPLYIVAPFIASLHGDLVVLIFHYSLFLSNLYSHFIVISRISRHTIICHTRDSIMCRNDIYIYYIAAIIIDAHT